MKNILVISYSQSGQLTKITDSVLGNLINDDDFFVNYHKIEPENEYPFPWTKKEFYDCMPECVNGIVCNLKNKEINDDIQYDLVVLAYQVWYLSPSIPFWSFLKKEQTQDFLKHKNVITILGVRNMWVNAHNKVHKELINIGANHVGNIVLADKNSNLISVLLVVKFLMTGNTKPYKWLPEYGVPSKDIVNVNKLGVNIKNAIINNNFLDLQKQIVDGDGVFLKFAIRQMELTASKVFVKWASFILKKGEAGNPKRTFRINLFKYYLIILIFLFSPFVELLFKIVQIIFYPFVKKSLNKTALMK